MQIITLAAFVTSFQIYFSSAIAYPFLELLDSRSCFVVGGDCPNKNITFWLYRNETREKPLQLDPLKLIASDFQPARPVKVLIHGYTGHLDYSPNTYIRPALLDNEDVYVISIDYGPLVREPCYFAAVENLPLVSKCLAQLINNLVKQKIVENKLIHVIGFSLGGQVAGQLSNYLNQKLTRITGLDPAKPLFITVGSDRKLDPNDAELVDVIHTDVLGRGMFRPMGHVDFYANIGLYQPGCETQPEPGSCSHDRAPQYYAESISSTKGFWGYACPSWLHYIFGICNSKSNDALMGYFVNKSYTGSYFLKTSSFSPFALGPLENLPPTDGVEENILSLNYEDIADLEPQLRRTFDELRINLLNFA